MNKAMWQQIDEAYSVRGTNLSMFLSTSKVYSQCK